MKTQRKSRNTSLWQRKLPESLRKVPNIPHEKQTLEQLLEERDYWQSKIDEASGWGAAVGVAAEFRGDCDRWIERRKREAGR